MVGEDSCELKTLSIDSMFRHVLFKYISIKCSLVFHRHS